MSPDASGPSVHPDLDRHQKSMQPQVFTLNGHIHVAFAYSVVNCTLIEGEDSCILVDTMTSVDTAEKAAEEFRKLTDKPITTVIYTHFHADHVSGTGAFVSEEDVKSGKVQIIGQEELTDHVMRDVGLIAPLLGRRAMYQFGMRLPVSSEGTVGAGLGPPQRPGQRTFMPPTTTFDKSYKGEVGGIKFEVHLTPSETEDQCCVWLPDEKVLLSADAVYESFPNVYALRGTRFRNPMVWAQGVDTLRGFGADTLIPHHGRPVEGAQKIEQLLTDYRDAIQFVHDQTLRYMNLGYRPDEIKEVVQMPERLKDHPWLGEFYGSYKHSIPAIYAGYIGWYQGDPVDLDPTPWTEKANRYVDMIGGGATHLGHPLQPGRPGGAGPQGRCASPLGLSTKERDVAQLGSYLFHGTDRRTGPGGRRHGAGLPGSGQKLPARRHHADHDRAPESGGSLGRPHPSSVRDHGH